MTDAALADALAAAAGADAVDRDAPFELDGETLPLRVAPADGAVLARVLAALAQAGVGCVVRGGGSRLGCGNPPRGARVLLETRRLDGVHELDAGEGVCRVGAGTPLAALREKVEAAGWVVPLDPPDDAATVGGALAAAAIGPRAQRFGLPRDVVLGLEVALASGERTRCGGRVVKNVTGYDLAKLYTGSFGTLGVIESAWLRLRPRPPEVRELVVRDAALAGRLDAARAAAGRATVRALALRIGAAGCTLVAELAGDPAALEADAGALASELGLAPGEGALADLCASSAATGAELRFRVSARASRLSACAEALRGAGAELLIHPGLGLLYASFAGGDEARIEAAWAAAADAAAAGGGAYRLEDGPLAAKRGRDVFGEAGGEARIAAALKRGFDPRGVLNPGRFAGAS